MREQRPQAAARAEETRCLEAGDDAWPYLPNSRRAGIMDASSSPWSPMVTPSGSQNSRRQCRASLQSRREEKAERRRGPARSKTPPGSRCLVAVGTWGKISEETGAEPTADGTRLLFLLRECVNPPRVSLLKLGCSTNQYSRMWIGEGLDDSTKLDISLSE